MALSFRRLREIARFLYLQRVKGFDVGDEPWLDEESKSWLSEQLAKADMYMEFGSGGSTRLAGRQGVPTISVEGDRFFGEAVRAGLATGHNVQILDPKIGLTMEWGIPMPGTPSLKRVKRWSNYVDVPFEVLHRQNKPFPNLFLVDGRFRRACVLRVALEAQRMRSDAHLLFDDYYEKGREHYHRIEAPIGAPRKIGRSAIFSISHDNPVRREQVEEAMQDYR